MTAGWGAPDGPEEASERIPSGAIDLGGGHRMVLNPLAFKALLHSPHAVRAVTKRAEEIASAADELAVTREGREAPEYGVTVHDDGSRARARIFPSNVEAALDNAAHMTLLRATDQHPSDPKDEV